MSELDDIEYSEDMPASTPATDETVGPDNITDKPINTPTDDKQTTIQTTGTNQPSNDTALPPKIENRGLVEQRKPRYKRKSTGMRQIQANSSKQAQGETNTKAARDIDTKTLPNLKQAMFVEHYTNPNSPTYGNKTRSYMRAYGNDNYYTAGKGGYALTKSPKIHTWIDDILKQHGADTQARVTRLAEVMHGNHIRTVRRQAITKGGEVVDLVDTYSPTANECTKAIDILNKLSGDYDTAKRANAQAEAEYKSLLKHTGFPQAKSMKAKATDAETVAEGDAPETTGEGD